MGVEDVEQTPIRRGVLTTGPFRSSLLARLFGLVFLAILPALVIQAYNELTLRQQRETELRNEVLRLAMFAAGELDRLADNAHTLLMALASAAPVRGLDRAACSAYLAEIKKPLPAYAQIGATDRHGNGLCGATPIPAQVNYADRFYFQQALETNGFTVGTYTLGRVVGRPVLPFAIPFLGYDGQVAGVVFVALDLQWLAEYFQHSRPFDRDTTLAVVDREATVVLRLPDNASYTGRKFPERYDRYLHAENPGSDEIVGVDGIARFLGFVPLDAPPRGLYVGIGLTKSVALAAIDRASLAGFFTIGVGLVAGLFVAWLFGRILISAPIEKLALAAGEWAAGNFGVRANLGRGSSELTRLGQSFDLMADQLQRHHRDNARLFATLEDRVAERTRELTEAQAELRQSSAELQAQAASLAAANRELQTEMRRREEAEEHLRQAHKMEAIGQLTGGVAHDFNNILQIILGALDGLHRRLLRGQPISPEDGLKRIEMAIRGGERAARLTAQLLAFARRQPLAPAAVEVNRLVANLSEMLRRTLGETIEIETVLAAGLWSLSADVSQLENAILNLAVNARDAMPRGGKLTIETANAFLDEAHAAEHGIAAGQYVMIALTDSGSGMPKEVLDKAFEPFFTTKEIGQGTGLGLSQVYGFIKQSGGHISLYSEVGRGTTVKMYLPRQPASERPASQTQPAGTEAPQGELILFVDDDPDVRAMTSAMLQELGYRVLVAPEAATALQIIAARPDIALLFTDVGLPEMDGRQLAEQALILRPDLKVMFTTGYARNAIVHHGVLDAGVVLLVKPFTSRDVGAKLQGLLGGSPD